jgi:hypothetical protein
MADRFPRFTDPIPEIVETVTSQRFDVVDPGTPNARLVGGPIIEQPRSRIITQTVADATQPPTE